VEDLIAIVVQFIFEVIGSIFIGTPFGFNTRKPTQLESGSLFLRSVLTSVGAILGYLSAYLLPFKLLPYSWLRLVNLIIAPLVGGYVAKTIAAHRAKDDAFIEPKVHFWNAFWFILSFLLLRIAYVSRFAT
jgi:hypothetical protein